MAFVLRRPFAITSGLRQLSQASKPIVRQFHQAPVKQSSLFTPKSAQAGFILSKQQGAFKSAFKRKYNVSTPPPPQSANGEMTRRILYGVGIFGGTLVAINVIFNRETRDDGGMPVFEREYLNDTFLHTGLGLGTIAVAASALHRSGWSVRLMSANPWLVFGVGLATSIGSMIVTRSTPPEK
jgi:hypothetical protein